MTILLSVYACNPNKSSESYVGWNWVKYLSKYRKLVVITHSENKEDIEKNILNLLNPKNVTFYYLDMNKKISTFLIKLDRRIHHFFWQRYVYSYLKKNQEILKNVSIIHHITYTGVREFDLLWKFKEIKYIWGPVGGLQSPIFLYSGLWNSTIAFELFRELVNFYYLNLSINFKNLISRSSIVFASNSTSMKMLPQKHYSKYHLMLETGIDKPKKQYRLKNSHIPVRILWSGNLIPLKGLPLLLQAASNTQKIAEFTIIGDGKFSNYYKKYIKDKGLQNVKFFGRVDYKKMQLMYRDADLFCFTSLRDTSGNVVLESMSKGIPTVVLNQHGAGDIIGSNGLRIDPISPEYIVTQLTKIITDRYNNRDYFKEIVAYQYEQLKLYYWEYKIKIINEYYFKVEKNELAINSQ